MWKVLGCGGGGEVGDYGPFESLKDALEFARDMNFEFAVNVVKIEIVPED